MKILITGICGFVGHALASALSERFEGCCLYGLDNLMRPGSELHRAMLSKKGVKVFYADLRNASDLEVLPEVDWVIDAAANPSVLAGTRGLGSTRQLVEHNLMGTVNLLEYCKRSGAGFVLLSTSRVYSIPGLEQLELIAEEAAFAPRPDQAFPPGLSPQGVSESYSTQAPVSLYGATKLASEALALEYGEFCGFPVWIDRCGVLAGAGQFGRPDQGIFSYWIHSWKQRRPLKYVGFGGSGKQVRDCLHPDDLCDLLLLQLAKGAGAAQQSRIVNLGGGLGNSMSLRELSAWCQARFGDHEVESDPSSRRFDIPWMVMDATRAQAIWDWAPRRSLASILEEIAIHAEAHPDWLEVSTPY